MTRSSIVSFLQFFASWLIYFVAHCMKRTSETVYLQSMIKEAHDKAETIRERVKMNKKKKLIPDHDFKHFFPISVLVVAGFFNRPTFLAFAFAPVFFWMQRGVATTSFFTPFQTFNFRMFAVLPGEKEVEYFA
jgi:phosphatidylinositol glycan class Z